MYEKLKETNQGYIKITDMEEKHPDMLQDIGIYVLVEGDEENLLDERKETAILLLEGTIRLEWNGFKQVIKRENVFEENPWCLHIPRDVEVKVIAIEKSEVLIQKTNNDNTFEAKLYAPEDCLSDNAGVGVWNGTAERVIRTIFDYQNAPYSNLVIGEVISYPGRWSSFPPHHHDQPEVYYYRFNKPQGFGCAMVGTEAYRVEHNSYITIPGKLDHPQTTAPGYAMYFCWMIRHLKYHPWTDRIIEEEHKWLLDPNVKIWPEK
ncbi:5-deoxy-glucuronate isomerase [Arthrobacter citreus]|nr:5-deoxy-glucuronate isomerase [Arthrobacter citreus]